MFPLLTILLVLVSASVVTGYQWQRIAHQHNHARSYSIASKQHIALLPVPARWATSSRTSNNVERSPAITNLKYGEVKPRVCRPIEDADRVALASLKVGQKLRGRIISVAEFGLFVDVGTSKDGLVHIRDISSDYFVSNLHSKFAPGQDIDVWVKFVLLKDKKLGLQMFPPPAATNAVVHPSTGMSTSTNASTSPSKNSVRKLSIRDLQPTMQLQGKVVRTSDFGVYVDIGVPDTPAFLHRRKMLSNRRQWKYRPWEITPLGTEVTCFVHEVDVARKRIAITTYPPELWATRLAPTGANRHFDRTLSYDDTDPMVEDNEELGGDTRAANMRARRSAALQLVDADDEDDDISDTEWERGETLSVAEIRALTAHRVSQQQLNDYDEVNKGDVSLPNPAYPASMTRTTLNGAADGAASTAGARNSVRNGAVLAHSAAANQLSTEELFESLSNKRSFLTLGELKKWQYVRQMLTDGALTPLMLQDLFTQSGARQGRMDVDHFEVFLDLFVDVLGLEEEDGDYFDIEDSALDGNGASRVKQGANRYLIDDLDESLKESKPTRTSRAATTAGTKTDATVGAADVKVTARAANPAKKASKNKTDNQSASATSTPAADGVAGAFLVDLFQQLSKGKIQYLQYSDLQQWDVLQLLVGKSTALSAQARSVFDACCAGNKGKGMDITALGAFVEKLAAQEALAEVNSAGTDGYYEEVSVDEAFQQLSLPPHSHITFAALRSWPLVGELLSEGHLQLPHLQDLYLQASRHNTDYSAGVGSGDRSVEETVLDMEGFNALLDLLDPFADSDLEADDDDDYAGAVDDENDWDSADGEDYEEISVEDAFQQLSLPPHSHITFAALRSWPLVSELLSEGHLQLLHLQDLYLQASRHNTDYSAGVGSGSSSVEETVLDIEGFNALLDLLDPFADSDLNEEADTTMVTADCSADDAEETDEQVSREAFAALAQGKPHVSLKDLLNWDFVYALLAEGVLTEELLQDKVKQYSNNNRKGLTQEGLDRLVDDLVLLYKDSDFALTTEGDQHDGQEDADGQDLHRLKQQHQQDDSEGSDAADEQDEEGPVLEIDIAEEFLRLCGDRGFVTLQDIQTWDAMQEALSYSDINDADWLDMAASAGVADVTAIDAAQFEAVVDALVERLGFCDEEGCDIEDNDHDNEHE